MIKKKKVLSIFMTAAFIFTMVLAQFPWLMQAIHYRT